MSTKKTKKVSVFTILILILCGLLAIYTVASFIVATQQISEMINFGTIKVSDSLYDIVNFYMTSCGIYIIYISILLAIWWTKHSLSKARIADGNVTEEVEYDKVETITDETSGIAIEEAEKIIKKEIIEDDSTGKKMYELDEKDSPELANEIKDMMNIPIEDEDSKK